MGNLGNDAKIAAGINARTGRVGEDAKTVGQATGERIVKCSSILLSILLVSGKDIG
jgi:hypothetical protein